MTLLHQDSLVLGPLRVMRRTPAWLAEVVLAALAPGGAPVAVAFCNAHTAELALDDPEFAAALQRFVVVNDGIGLEIAARFLEGRGFPDNLNGTDFLPYLFARLERPARVYLLGAAPGIAGEAGDRFAARFPNVDIVGARDGYFAPEQEAEVVAAVAATRPDIVLVAFGNPKQELFIARHFEALGAKAAFGVGALLDFTAGKVARAPAWMRKARLEWAFRMAQEPGRLVRRYTVGIGWFLVAVLRLWLSAGPRQIL